MRKPRKFSGSYDPTTGAYSVTPADSGRTLASLTVDPADPALFLGAITVRRYTGTANTSATHNRTWTNADSASNRLVKFGMVPYNSLEVSKNYNDVYHGLYGNVVTVRFAEWWKLCRDPARRGYVPVDEYFAALEKCSDLKTYIRLLALWRMTGASEKPFYVDTISPLSALDKHFVYQGFPDPIKRDDGSVSAADGEYALFWDRYWNAVLGFIELATHEFLGEAVDMLTLKRQYDLQSLIAQARYLQSKLQSIAPGQTTNSILEYLLALPFSLPLKIIGIDADTMDPADSKHESHQASKGVYYYPANQVTDWYTHTAKLTEFSTKFLVKIGDQTYNSTVAEMLRMLWNSAIGPYAAQLSDMLAQIDYIGKPDNLLTEADIALIKDYDKNLFLKFAVDQSTQKGIPVFEQTASAPILERYSSQLNFIEQPQLSYMQQSFLNIPQTAAKFAPVYSVQSTGDQPQPVKKSNLLLWLLAGGAAAAAYWYSNR